MQHIVGLTVLVCAVVVGLAHLAVKGDAEEHAIASLAVAILAVPVFDASAGAGVLLALALVGTARLRRSPVPDRVPREWADA